MNREVTAQELLHKAPIFDRDVEIETMELTMESRFDGRAFTPWAIKQLCTTVGIPYSFFKRCPRDLQVSIMTYWLQERNKKVVLRQSPRQNIAVLSPRYNSISHQSVIKIVVDNTPSNWMYWPIEIGYDLRFYALAPSDNGVKVGLYVQNSIIGHASLSIQGCIFKLVCSNGLIVPIFNGQQFRAWHTRKNLKLWLKDILTNVNIRHMVTLSDRLQGSQIYPIDRVQTRCLLEDSKLPKNVQKAFLKQRGFEMLSLINFISREAKNYPPTRRVELEQFAGSVLQSMV